MTHHSQPNCNNKLSKQSPHPLRYGVPSLRVQQAKIDRLTSMAAKWSTGDPHRADSSNFHNTRHRSTRHCSTSNMSPVTQSYNRQHMYNDNQGHQRYSNYTRRSQQYNRQEMDQRYFHSSQNIDNNNVSV